MIHLLIVDDHVVVRKGLQLLLEQQPDITVVGEAGDGAQAITLAGELLPDVILMDLLMPTIDGITATQHIKRIHPTAHIIALTSSYEDELLFSAIHAGACSYLIKDTSPDELIETIRSAAVGDCKLSSRVAERLLFEMQHQSKSLVNELTAREIEVLKEIARGYSNRKIASDLSVSERTIKTHVSNILSKLYLEDRTQAAIYALQHHLVPLNETFSKQ